jgi:replicative superfamily II helicase
MPDIVKIEYHQTGESVKNTANGMRPMASRAYEERKSQYLLIKAPPASGKSRALMFLALDKIRKQGLKKVIVAVPERSIAGSFAKGRFEKGKQFFCQLGTQ